MKAEVEVYKGIEFVRLSVLGKEDAKAIRQSPFNNRIIKILQGTTIISDCFPWSAYEEWFQQQTLVQEVSVSKPEPANLPVNFKLALE